MWMMLTQREVELLERRVTGGDNAAIMRTIQARIDRVTGELTLSDDEIEMVKAGVRDWRGGYEKQLKALLLAVDRHTTSGRA